MGVVMQQSRAISNINAIFRGDTPAPPLHPPPFGGTPKLHKGGGGTLCIVKMRLILVTWTPSPLSKILYTPRKYLPSRRDLLNVLNFG